MAIAGQLEIQLLADVARLRSDMTQAKGIVSGAMNDMSRAAAQLRSVFGALGIGLGVGLFARLIKGSLDAQDELSKLSQKVGISVESLAGLQHAASLSGVSFEGLQKGIKSLSTQMFDANMGLAESKRNFAALGVSVTETDGRLKSAEAVMIEVADRFAMMQDGTLKTALAVKLFGKAGLDMIPMLNEGSEALAKMVEEGQRLNPVTAESAKQAEIFNDNMERLGKTVSAVGVRFMNDLLPYISQLSEIFASDALSGEVDKSRDSLSVFGEILKVIVVVGGNVAFVLKAVGLELGGIAAQMTALATGDFSRFAEISRLMKSDAEANRKAFDEWEKKIMSLGAAAAKTGAQLRFIAEEDIDAANRAAAALAGRVEAEKNAAAMAKQAAADRMQRAQAEIDAEEMFAKDYFEAWEHYNKLRNADYEKAAKEREIIAKAEQDAEEMFARDFVEAWKFANAYVLEEDRRRQEEARIHAQEQIDTWTQIGDVAGNFFSDLVMNGKSAFDNLKRWVRQLLAEMIKLFATRWVLQMGAAAVGGGGAGSALASGATSYGTNTLAGTALSAGSAYLFGTAATGAGAAAGSAFAGATAAGATSGAIGAGGAMASVYSALSAIPVWGWIAMAVIAAFVYFSGRGGGPKPGGSFFGEYDSSGNFIGSQTVPGTDNGRFFTPSTGDAAMEQLTNSFTEGMFAAITRFGGTSGGFRAGFGFDQDPSGTADSRISALLTDRSGNQIFSQTLTGGRDDEDFQRATNLLMQRTLLAALQASELPESIALILEELDPLTATTEELTEAFRLADIAMATLNLGIQGLDFQSLQEFQQYGEDIGATFERIAGIWAWFTDNFYTDAERLEMATRQVNDVFEDLGIAVPESITDFRLLVEGIDLSTESGRTMWATLMQIAPAFLQVRTAADDAADAVDDLTDSLSDVAIVTDEIRRRQGEDVRRSRESQLADVIGARRGIRDFLDSTRLDPGLTTLDPMQRLEEARRQYEEVLGLARGGDLDAAGRLGGSSDTYLRIAREIFASGSGYVDIFRRVMGDVEGVDERLANDQRQLEAILGMAATMTEVRDLLLDIRDGTYEAPRQIAASFERATVATKRR